MLRITFEIKSPLMIDHNGLMLDGLLAWSYFRGMGIYENTLHIKDILQAEIPIKKHTDGYYLCSRLLWDESANDVVVLKKKFREKYVEYANLPNKVLINKGEFKSYQIPFQVVCTNEAYFIFDSDNIKLFEELFKRVHFLGKKGHLGFGRFNKYRIEKDDSGLWENEILRPIPEQFINPNKYEVLVKKFCSWHYPYWDIHYRQNCVVGGKRKSIVTNP